MTDPVGRLRGLLARDGGGRRRLLSVPGCWDGLSALLIAQAGFPVAFLSGGAVAMARLGRPDLGLTTATEVADLVATVRDRVDLPLIVDGDTGFGGTLNLQRTVRAFERAGASAMQIEDQLFPKRCGHMAGKRVVPPGEALGRIKAALDARHAMLIVARTDALAAEGLDGALDRAAAFVEAGADLVFVEGPRTRDDLARVGEAFGRRVPLVHNLVEGGVTPTDRGDDLEALGFAVALHPLLLLHGLVRQAPGWLARLRADRSSAALAGEIATLAEINALVGAAEMIEQGNRYDEQG